MLDAVFLRQIPFPRSACLWVLLDRQGLRQEVLERGEKHVRRLGALQRVAVAVERGRGKYPILQSMETVSASAAAPAWYAFDTWLAEMVDIGLPADDPHPELFALLTSLPRDGQEPSANLWGLAAAQVAAIFGIWSPPERCACDASPDRAAPRYFCARCRDRAPEKFLTACGEFHVPLALLLDDLDRAFRQAFDRGVESARLIRQLGQRGLLPA